MTGTQSKNGTAWAAPGRALMRTGHSLGQGSLAACLGLCLCLCLAVWSILPGLSHLPQAAPGHHTHAHAAPDRAGAHAHAPTGDDIARTLSLALHGHDHDTIDHDHSPALTGSAPGWAHWPPDRDGWRLRAAQDGPRRIFRIERPPRA